MGITPYTNGVGNVMHDTICSRLDLAYAIIILKQFMEMLTHMHWKFRSEFKDY